MRQFQYPRSPWVYLALACVALMFVISGGAFLVLLARLFVYLVVVYMLAPAAAVALVYLAVRALAKRTGWGRRHLARLLSRRQPGPEVGRYETSPADPSWEPPATPPPTWPASPVPPPPAPAPAVPVVEVRHVFVGPDVAATMSQPSPFAVPAHPQNCTCHGSGVVACPWSQAAGGES